MPTLPLVEARQAWQEAWRKMPRTERGSPRAIFAFITENREHLPTEWEGLAGDPWTTIHEWLQKADRQEGIECAP